MVRGALALIMHSCEMARGNFWGQQVAIAAIEALSRLDYVGIVTFNFASPTSSPSPSRLPSTYVPQPAALDPSKFDVKIFESQAEISEKGYGFNVSSSAMRILSEHLGCDGLNFSPSKGVNFRYFGKVFKVVGELRNSSIRQRELVDGVEPSLPVHI